MGELIIQLRKQKGWSQEYLAERSGVSRQIVSRWESGRATPTYKNVLLLSEIFGVSVDYFTGDKELSEEAAISEQPQEGQGTIVRKKKRGVFFYIWLGIGIFLAGLVAVIAGCIVFSPNKGVTSAVSITFSHMDIVVFVVAIVFAVVLIAWFIYSMIRGHRKEKGDKQ